MSLFIYHVDEFVGKAFEIVRCLVAFTATASALPYTATVLRTVQQRTHAPTGDERRSQAKTRGYTHDIMDQTAFHWIEVVVSECSYSTAGVLEAR